MSPGEWLTRGAVWVALSLYVGAEIARRCGAMRAGRWLNTVGCAAFLAHVGLAFHFYHGWSHSAAYADTARQTAELTGWNSGAGIYVNYLFALFWIGAAIWNWAGVNRPTWIMWTARVFFWFMIFNGAVVFAQGAMRGYGLLLCLVLIGCWWRRPKSVGE